MQGVQNESKASAVLHVTYTQGDDHDRALISSACHRLINDAIVSPTDPVAVAVFIRCLIARIKVLENIKRCNRAVNVYNTCSSEYNIVQAHGSVNPNTNMLNTDIDRDSALDCRHDASTNLHFASDNLSNSMHEMSSACIALASSTGKVLVEQKRLVYI